MTTTILTIDADSITVILASDEIDALAAHGIGSACRQVAEAMQRVATRHGIDAEIGYDATGGRARGEDHATWERLAIDLVDEVRAEVGLEAVESDDMLGRPVLDYQTGDDTGRVATAEDVMRQMQAGEGAYECPVTGASVYISR